MKKKKKTGSYKKPCKEKAQRKRNDRNTQTQQNADTDADAKTVQKDKKEIRVNKGTRTNKEQTRRLGYWPTSCTKCTNLNSHRGLALP